MNGLRRERKGNPAHSYLYFQNGTMGLLEPLRRVLYTIGKKREES